MNREAAPIRVAQLVEALEPGGAEALVVDIANGLAERGHDSRIVVLRGGGAFADRIGSNVIVHDLRRPRRDGAQLQRIAYFLGTAWHLVKLIRDERIQVLQCHLPKANFLGLVVSMARSCGVCVTVHNNHEFDYGDDAGPLKRRLRRAGYRQMLRYCQRVISVSEQVRQSLLRELGVDESAGKRIRVVHNGVRLRELPSMEARAAARKIWQVTGDEVLIVAVGRLTRQKNHKTMLQSLGRLSATGVQWRCVIAGEGELEAELRHLLEADGLRDRVVLAGLVADIPGLLAAADVFCLPSLFEGLPLALLEAMAAGLPVVGTKIDGVAELVSDGEQGRLAVPGDPEGFRAALEDVLADRDRMSAMGKASRQVIEQGYAFESVLHKLESIYAEVDSMSRRLHAES